MNFKFLQLVIVFAVLLFASCNNGGINKNVKLESETDSVSYSLGVDIANSFKDNGIEGIDVSLLAAGYMQVMDGDSIMISAKDAKAKMNMYYRKMQKLRVEKNSNEGKAFLEENKKKDGIVTTESGLQYKVITKGDGPIPTAENKVKVHYKGTLIDGKTFDSSYDRGKPAEFPVTGVIKGWQEALQLMPVGSKWKVYIPSDIAYGQRGNQRGGIAPNSTLIFEMELLEIVKEEEKKEEKKVIEEAKGE